MISVIIPNYNAEKYIERCLESVLSQSYKDVEVIVVDDGSTDESPSIIRNFVERSDRIRAYFQPNQNASIARNKGIDVAVGDYLYFLDSDDLLYPDGLKSLINAAEENSADLVIGNMNEIDESDKIIENDLYFDETLELDSYLEKLAVLPAPPNKLYKASVIKDNRIVFGNVRIGQDTNFYLKYLACAQKVIGIADVIYGWRHVPTSITHAMDYHIFDIVYSFANVRAFYKQINAEDTYYNHIRPYEFRTYYRQMDKQRNFKIYKQRRLVTDYFIQYIDELGDISDSQDYAEYRNDYKNYKIKKLIRLLYLSPIYRLKNI